MESKHSFQQEAIRKKNFKGQRVQSAALLKESVSRFTDYVTG